MQAISPSDKKCNRFFAGEVEYLIKVLTVLFVSSFKFAGGPPLAYAYNFSYAETIVLTVSGGLGGVLLVSYYTPFLMRIWSSLLVFWKGLFAKKKERSSLFSKPLVDVDGPVDVRYTYVPSGQEEEKKVFTKKSRRIVRIWKKYGLIGIAILTPILLSIPVGTFIASRLVPQRRTVILYMLFALVFWSVLLSSLFELYQVMTLTQLEQAFFQ